MFLFLGANAHLGPASSEGLSVCLYVCLCICNTLAPLPSPMTKITKMTNKQKRKTNKQSDRETEIVAQQLNIFLYQASIIASHWIISFINTRYNRMYLETHLSYHPFHKTLPRSSASVNRISVRFYETGCSWAQRSYKIIQINIQPEYSRIWDWFSIRRILFQCFLFHHPFIA